MGGMHITGLRKHESLLGCAGIHVRKRVQGTSVDEPASGLVRIEYLAWIMSLTLPNCVVGTAVSST